VKPRLKHPPKLDPKKHAELKALAELVGEFIEYWGFKAVQGRMWCYLYLIKEPLDSRQLSQLLQISPALVTQSVQVLLKFRVILEAEKGKNGVLRFMANPNVSEAIASVLEGRELALLKRVHKAQQALSSAKSRPGTPLELATDRTEQVGQWIELAMLFLHSGIESMKQEQGPFENPEPFKELASSLR
jgi:DNA-binding transcriptional regulator GbsR (MarR family)